MNLDNERKAFDIWHLKQFKDINDDLNDDEAEHLYQRVYSHEAQDLIRQMEFNAWLSSANRQGYKIVPVDATQEIYIKYIGARIEAKELRLYDMQFFNHIYKAMIGAVE